MNIFQPKLNTGSFKTSQGEILTKVGTNHMKQYGKGHSLDCIDSNYIYSDTVIGDFNTIVLDFWLNEKITAASATNVLGSFGSASNGSCVFGSVSGLYVNETFSIFKTTTSDGVYIKDTIQKGYNQIILRHNSSYYDIFLNGSQCTTYNNGSALFSNSKIYIGARQAVLAQKFTGQILDCSIDNESFTSQQITQSYRAFQHISPIVPPIRNFNYARNVFQGNNINNNIILSSTINLTGNWEIEYYTKGYTPANYKSVIGHTTNASYIKHSANVSVTFLNSAVTPAILNFSAIDTSIIHHWRYVATGTVISLYLDGVFVDSKTINTNMTISRLGRCRGAAQYFNGDFWNVKITLEDNIVGNYLLDESTGTVAFDTSENANDGTYVGSNYRKNVILHREDMPYLYEKFERLAADGKTIFAPLFWISGTGTLKIEEDSESKYMECVTNGTISIQTDPPDTSRVLTIQFYNGSSWTTYSDTIANMVSTHAWISSFNDKTLTFDLSIGDRIRNILITD